MEVETMMSSSSISTTDNDNENDNDSDNRNTSYTIERAHSHIARELQTLSEMHKMDVSNSSRTSKQPSRNRHKLQPRHQCEFPSDSKFDQLARVVCKVDAIPRKEVFEAWAMALYVHHHFPTATRIVDIACSHGILSWALLLLAQPPLTQPQEESHCRRSVVCVDLHMPKSSEKIAHVMLEEWPEFKDYWHYVEGPAEALEPHPSTLLVGIHACGLLSDKIITLALQANAPLALVPCCHSKKCLTTDQKNERNVQNSNIVVPYTLADFIDQYRIQRLQGSGFQVREALIPKVFTPKNRILLATPPPTTTTTDSEPATHNDVKNQQLSMTTKGQPHWGMPTMVIPVADTPHARATVRSLAGRAAANQRKAKPPPSLSVTVSLPSSDTTLSADEIQTILSPEQARAEALDGAPFWNSTLHCYERTFRIRYDGCTKAEAKEYHIVLREEILKAFPGTSLRY